jgi:hypothetical protein
VRIKQGVFSFWSVRRSAPGIIILEYVV